MVFDRLKQSAMMHHERYAEEVHRQNSRMLAPCFATGLVISIVILISRLFAIDSALAVVSGIQMAYYVVALAATRFVPHTNKSIATVVAYLVIIPPLVMSLLASTVMDPGRQGITYLLFLVVLPLFVTDRPARQIGAILTFTAVFIALSFACKPSDIFLLDLVHAIEFGAASICINMLITGIQYSSIDNYLSSKSLSEHHELTGLQNRRAFMAGISSYDGQALTVAMVDLDDFKFFNDTYGHALGDAVIVAFGAALRDAFGEDACFNYGGDEFLIVASTGDEAQFLEGVSACRATMEHLRLDGREFHVHFSCGYVFGTTANRATTLEMTTYADANLYRAKNHGRNQAVGGAYLASSELASTARDDLSRMAGGRDIDPITGLPMLDRFADQAQKYLNNVAGDDEPMAVVFMDIEDLKGLNQEHGYDTGDKLLEYLARKIAERFEGQLVGAAGAGGFFVLAPDDDTLAERLNGAHEDAQNFPLVGKIYLKAGVYTCEAGVGMSLACDNARLACADLKRDRSIFWRRFDQHIEEKLKRRLYVIRNFTSALEQGWAHVIYQPIYDMASKKLCGLEALGRWVDPDRGEIPPDDFVPLLEEYRLLGEFNLYMVKQVCEFLADQRDKGEELKPISVNTSLSTLGLKDMVGDIAALLDEFELPHDLLIVEITERAFGENPGLVRRQVEELRAAGIRVWLDGFGSIGSGLTALMAMDFDCVKVDASVLGDAIDVEAKNTKILIGMKAILDDLGVEVLAEGVSNAAQRDFLLDLGITKMQRAV